MMGTCDSSCNEHCKGSCVDSALLILRIALGVIFIVHGYGKLFGNAPGMEMFTGMVDRIGFPLPVVFAYAAALTEFVGGIAMILGLGVRMFGVLMSIVMIVAFSAVKNFALPAGDPDLALLAMAISLTLMGGGMYSLDAKFGIDKMLMKMGKK